MRIVIKIKPYMLLIRTCYGLMGTTVRAGTHDAEHELDVRQKDAHDEGGGDDDDGDEVELNRRDVVGKHFGVSAALKRRQHRF